MTATPDSSGEGGFFVFKGESDWQEMNGKAPECHSGESRNPGPAQISERGRASALHDGVKQMVAAMLIRMDLVVRNTGG
jgi:hypothetical protein